MSRCLSLMKGLMDFLSSEKTSFNISTYVLLLTGDCTYTVYIEFLLLVFTYIFNIYFSIVGSVSSLWPDLSVCRSVGWLVGLSVFLSIYLSISISLYVSIKSSIMYPFICCTGISLACAAAPILFELRYIYRVPQYTRSSAKVSLVDIFKNHSTFL